MIFTLFFKYLDIAGLLRDSPFAATETCQDTTKFRTRSGSGG
jgi:hypothetical protein